MPAHRKKKKGDKVRIQGQLGSGVILSIKGKTASVQFGEMKSLVDISKLEKITGSVQKEITSRLRSVGINIHEKQSQFNPTLDLRGFRVEEAIPMIHQFLDTAILLGAAEIKILHGKCEGVLRKVVRDELKQYKQIASVADEHVERGGDGITIVVLK